MAAIEEAQSSTAAEATPADFRYPPHVLTSASLFPPPPPNYVHFTPLNLCFWSVLKEHIHPDDDSAAQPGTRDDLLPSSSTAWKNPRLDLQRATLLRHASSFDALPEDVRNFAERELGIHDDAGLAEEIRSGRVASVDLRLEMDPPDLAVVVGSPLAAGAVGDSVAKEEATAQPQPQPPPLGGYHLFGEWWPVPAKLTGLEEAGVKRLYDEGGQVDAEGRVDRRPALLMLLRSLLTSYLKLLSLLQFPPSYWALRTLHTTTSSFSLEAGANPSGNPAAAPPETHTHTQEEDQWLTTSASHWNHVRTLALNFQEALNRSRKEQARRNLEGILAVQLARRREQTRGIRAKLRDVRIMLDGLRNAAADAEEDSGDGSDYDPDLDSEDDEGMQGVDDGDAKRIPRGGGAGTAAANATAKVEAMDVD